MITKDLGVLSGSLLLFGGVYSNVAALRALKALAQAQHIPAERIICTGDIVAYGAQPEECVQMIRDWGIHNIAGNVELQLRSGAENCGCDFRPGSRCDTFSQHWYPYAQQQLSADSLQWMQSLPDHLRFTYTGYRMIVLHGGYRETSRYVFRSTPWAEKADILAAAHADVAIAGHCGLPFAQQQGRQYWLNPGVIGMPANDGTPRVWCMLLQQVPDGFTYEHLSLTYDHLLAQRLMRERELPEAYAKTLSTGLWDNCEILPKTETLEQGQRLELGNPPRFLGAVSRYPNAP